MFLRLFNNIVIKRTNKDNNTKDIKVNCVFAQRSRVLKDWQNSEKRATIKLPMIAITRTSYTRNGERLNNMHNEVKYEMTSQHRKYDLLTPIPIDISYDVVVMGKYPSDVDQIASNFMIFFNPDVYVTCQHPKYEGIKLNNQIIMSDSVTEEHPDELDSSTDDFTTTTFQFTFKTYLFGGNEVSKKVPRYVLSTYLSSVVSSFMYQLTQDDKNNISNFINNDLYMLSTKLVETTLTAYIDNPNLSAYVYDGFTPIIKNINMGFYPVPNLSSFVPYMNDVDNMALSEQWQYVDRITWTVDETTDYSS